MGALVAAVTFVGLGTRSGSLDDPSLVLFFVAGAVAVCAMILPGISGSFLLLLFGMYVHVIDAVNARDLLVLGRVRRGVHHWAGVVLDRCSTGLLRHYHDRCSRRCSG